MRITLLLAAAGAAFFASCGGGAAEKLLVYTNNGASINEAAKEITIKDTFGHNEKEIVFKSGDKAAINVKAADGNKSIEIPGAGYYVVNAKARDTIIGGFQKYSAPDQANRVMTQEQLARNIDSLKQMLTGSNISEANKTFFIPPYSAAKITDNADAFIVGPYHRMTSIEKVGDKDPEVYRFYSVREIRETIGKLEKLTGAGPAADSTGK